MTSDQAPRPAATLIIFRHARPEPEVLMLIRGSALRFAGGACVFPGGGVDPADVALAATLPLPPGWDGAPDLAARIAAIRETLEETGLAIGLKRHDGQPIRAEDAATARALLGRTGALGPVLEQMGWRIAPDSITPFARWCPRLPRPYDTRFYLADLGTGNVTLSPDAQESEDLLWLSPREALARADAGDLTVIFPTRRNLERLARFADFAQTQAHARATPLTTITPQIVERDGTSWLTIPDGLGYRVLEQRLDEVKRA